MRATSSSPSISGRETPRAALAFGLADVVEVLWREADLTDRRIEIAQRRTARFPGAGGGAGVGVAGGDGEHRGGGQRAAPGAHR